MDTQTCPFSQKPMSLSFCLSYNALYFFLAVYCHLTYLLLMVHLLQLDVSSLRAETLFCALCMQCLKQNLTHTRPSQYSYRTEYILCYFIFKCACTDTHISNTAKLKFETYSKMSRGYLWVVKLYVL